MGTFSFSKSRKKPPPQLVLAEPMSKAHKILGSTPLNIDSPKVWDDASSGFSGGTADSTLHSYGGTEDDVSDHHVTIASEEDWANESAILPALSEVGEIDDESEYTRTDIARTLRKTQSSSTIRSWYDKSKQPLSVSQQTSASAIAKGPPLKAHKMLDFDAGLTEPKPKKKPPMLDFTNLRTGSRLGRKSSHSHLRTDGTMMNSPDGIMRSPSIMSLMTPTNTRNREPRKIQKRQTKDSSFLPTATSPQPDISSPARRRGSSSKEIPSLYDHYEQMPLRNANHEPVVDEAVDSNKYEQVDPSTQRRRERSEPHNVLPDTPRTAILTGISATSKHNRSTSNASKATKTSKVSKNMERNLGDADLQETSVLLLTSGSEDEEEDEGEFYNHARVATPNRRPSEEEHVSPRTKPTKQKTAPSHSAPLKGRRSSKRTSFAPSDTYITIPNTDERRVVRNTDLPNESRSSTPYEKSSLDISCRSSLLSNLSNTSGLTIRNNAGQIEEARAVTMLPARRPSRVAFSSGTNDNINPAVSRSSSMPSQHPSLSTSSEQLTPPLSPTSVDFYIRPADSSIDETGSQSRFMAVTRQEELLLSALRQKRRHNEDLSLPDMSSHSVNENEEGSARRENSSPVSQVLTAEAYFDFGFPAPPTGQRQSFGDALNTVGMRSKESFNSADKLSQSSIDDFSIMSDKDQATLSPAPANLAPRQRTSQQASTPQDDSEQEEIILYLDEDKSDGEPSPDLSDFQDFGYLASGSFQRPPSVDGSQDNGDYSHNLGGRLATQTPDAKLSDRLVRSRLGMSAVPEDGELDEDEGGVPRPDSPISPDAFPAVPQVRTTLSSIARLSAFGPAPRLNEPGWWGDDD
ncbi:hypothetical protein K4F52_002612 [Lecanicillium sp. MT-2017a]|nr:hypothetical protein K4F52_002612 [Lecanicillium sp. MT-2017a]